MKTIIQESYFNECDDITCIDDYEEMPEYIKLSLPDECLPVIHKIMKTLRENPDFKSISMAGNLFKWEIDENYEGKARHGEITFLNFDNGRNVYSFFSFINEYTGAEFEVNCTNLVDEAIKND